MTRKIKRREEEFQKVKKIIDINNRLLELCVYALIRDTPIYKHELDTLTKLNFMDIIMKNLNDDTGTLKDKLLYQWNLERTDEDER